MFRMHFPRVFLFKIAVPWVLFLPAFCYPQDLSVDNFVVSSFVPISVDPLPARVLDENQSIRLTVDVRATEGEPVSVRAGALPLGASFDSATRQFSYTPPYNTVSTSEGRKLFQVTFTATDSTGQTASRDLQITVNNVQTPLALKRGLSLFSLPATPAAGYTAARLLEDINAAGGRAAFLGRTDDTGKFQLVIPGLPSGDFPLEAARGYLASLGNAITLRFPAEGFISGSAAVKSGLNILPLYGTGSGNASGILSQLNTAANQARGTSSIRYVPYLVAITGSKFQPYVDGLGAGDFSLQLPTACIAASAIPFSWPGLGKDKISSAKTGYPLPSSAARFYQEISSKISQSISKPGNYVPVVMDIADASLTLLAGKQAPKLQLLVHAVDIRGGTLRYRIIQGPKNATIDAAGVFRFQPSSQQAGWHTMRILVFLAKNSKISTQKTLRVQVVVPKYKPLGSAARRKLGT